MNKTNTKHTKMSTTLLYDKNTTTKNYDKTIDCPTETRCTVAIKNAEGLQVVHNKKTLHNLSSTLVHFFQC